MSPEEFKRARDSLGLNQEQMVDLFGLGSERTVRRWEDGTRDIPGPVLLLMELCLELPEVRSYLGLKTR
jgi:DNA-binding transcriptional regulator YiaG